jgi:hypothetical protein
MGGSSRGQSYRASFRALCICGTCYRERARRTEEVVACRLLSQTKAGVVESRDISADTAAVVYRVADATTRRSASVQRHTRTKGNGASEGVRSICNGMLM